MASEERHEKCWIVSGRVQGVSFRAFVQRRARTLGLTGYAQNLDDGDVRVFAIGPPDDLAALRRALAKGPRHARVHSVHETPAPFDHRPPQRGFAIR